MIVQDLRNAFTANFEDEPLLVSAPARINLIGEHTDYNEGFVLPAAINRHIVFAISRSQRDTHKLLASDLDESVEIRKDEIKPNEKNWSNYLLGVIAQLQKKGLQIEGVNCVFGGDIPLGAGLSSSAALETGFAFALNELFDLELPRLEIVQLSQMAEHEYAGVKCGIMDQFASVFGEKNKAIRLDCRSLEYEFFPFQLSGYDIVLCDTQVEHALAATEYNARRHECEAGVSVLQKYENNIGSLRDATPEMIEKHRDKFDVIIHRRCKYVVEENRRLLQACEALSNNDIGRFGELMYQTHEGLKDEYQVSCSELDVLVEIARNCGAVAGARMMGGGFGGCTINIVKSDERKRFIEKAEKEYFKAAKRDLKIYHVSVEQGTHVIQQG